MTTEPSLPPLRKLNSARRQALEELLLTQIHVSHRTTQSGVRRGVSRSRLLVAAVVVAAVVLVAPALALSTTLRNLVGLGTAPSHQLYYGMTPKQVQKKAGRPRTKAGACWYYLEVHGTVGSLIVGVPGSIAYRTADRLKLCFYDGQLNSEFNHVRVQGVGYEWVSVNL